MDPFIAKSISASTILELKAENQKKFNAIRNRIEKRLISVATPVEIVRMLEIVRMNDVLQMKLNRIIQDMSKLWKENETHI